MRATGRQHAGGMMLRWIAVLGAMMGTLLCAGAQTVPGKQPNGTYTLHVYTDLLQVPTLVLTRLHSSYRSLTPQSFTVSLNGGPSFHPTNVRLEGEDPVTLAILLDRTTDAPGMFDAFANAVPALPAGVFSSRDNVSVYSYGCTLVRTSENKPATPEDLRESMGKVLSGSGGSSAAKQQPACGASKRLLDVIARVGEDLARLPGRRVILVISDGADSRSVNSWPQLVRYANSKSITIFGLRPTYSPKPVLGVLGNAKVHDGWLSAENADAFGSLCASTGGVVLDTDASQKLMARQMERLMSMLRNRYIVEFPRPVNGTAGQYSIEVQVRDPRAIVRPAGVAFPPRAEDAKAPEGTLPEDTSRMPVLGTEQSKQPHAEPK